MKKIIGFIMLLAACGSADNGDLFDYSAGDAGLGENTQSLGTKFSSVKSFGYSANPKRSACTVANGGGVSGITYHNCYIPATKAITYQVTGTDPYEDECAPGQLCYNSRSYKGEAGMAAFRLDSLLTGAWSFTQVTVQPAQITVTSGNCSGDPMTSDNIQTFVCTSHGTTSTVSESLAGIYKKRTTGYWITVDVQAIEDRTNGSADFHQLLEHGMLAAWWAAVGIGTEDTGTGYWNDGRVELDIPGRNSPYDSHDIAAGDLCRANAYVTTSPTTFAALTGSCAN